MFPALEVLGIPYFREGEGVFVHDEDVHKALELQNPSFPGIFAAAMTATKTPHPPNGWFAFDADRVIQGMLERSK